MKHVPKYLLPRIAPVPGAAVPTGSAAEPQAASSDVGFVPFSNRRSRGRGGARGRSRGSGGVNGRGTRRKSDPLRKFG